MTPGGLAGADLREREKDRRRRSITGASQDGFDLLVRETRSLALDAATPLTAAPGLYPTA